MKKRNFGKITVTLNNETVNVDGITIEVIEFCKPLLAVSYNPVTDQVETNASAYEMQEYDESRATIPFELWMKIAEWIMSIFATNTAYACA